MDERSSETRQNRLSRYYTCIEAAVGRLESARRTGQLRRVLFDEVSGGALPRTILDYYEELINHPDLISPDVSLLCARCGLEEARRYLYLAGRTFDATVLYAPGSLPAIADDVDPDSFYSRSPQLFAAKSGDQAFSMRLDQVLASRWWSIGVAIDEREAEGMVAAALIEAAVHALLSHLRAGGFIERRLKGPLLATAMYERTNGIGFDFERLIRDVLNEHGRFARMAPLREDLFEKTDLRVQYPALKRQRGARVQISLSSTEVGLQDKLGRMIYASEFVMVSPYALAQAVREAMFDESFESLDWESFWCELGAEPTTLPELAIVLRNIYLRALERRADHPLGPAWFVPPTLRQFIQLFVRSEAERTTSNLRQRERVEGTKNYLYRQGKKRKRRAAA